MQNLHSFILKMSKLHEVSIFKKSQNWRTLLPCFTVKRLIQCSSRFIRLSFLPAIFFITYWCILFEKTVKNSEGWDIGLSEKSRIEVLITMPLLKLRFGKTLRRDRERGYKDGTASRKLVIKLWIGRWWVSGKAASGKVDSEEKVLAQFD